MSRQTLGSGSTRWPGSSVLRWGIHLLRLETDPYDRGWRATFYVTGMDHPLTSDAVSAWEPTPWRLAEGPMTAGC
jgi:hypothetical protein